MTEEANILLNIIPEGKLSLPEYKEWICGIECSIMAAEGSVDRHTCGETFKLENTFTPGLYTRQIFMPAGSLVVSRIHLFEHPFIVSRGVVSVYDGEEIVTMTAPFQGVTNPGTKRVLYVHEDTIWTTFHVTDKKTFEEVDASGCITCDTYQEFESISHKEIEL